MAIEVITFNSSLFKPTYESWSNDMAFRMKQFYGDENTAFSLPKEQSYTMLTQYALPTIGNRVFMAYCSEDENYWNSETNAIARVLGWLKRSEDRFIPLLKAYEQEADLLRKVETKEGVALMPQSATMANFLDSAPEQDDLSRVNVRLADGMTPIERLSEIEGNITSVYEKWANEFINAFVLSM